MQKLENLQLALECMKNNGVPFLNIGEYMMLVTLFLCTLMYQFDLYMRLVGSIVVKHDMFLLKIMQN